MLRNLHTHEIERLREALSRAHGYLSRASLAAECGKDGVEGDGPLTYPYAVGAAMSAIETAIATLARAEGRSDGFRDDDVPQAQCPRCKQWQDDYDGFGVLSCVCGYCAHAATDDGVCVFCGEREGRAMSDRDPLLAILRGLHDALAQLADTTHWAAERARKILADAEVDRLLREQEQADRMLRMSIEAEGRSDE